MQVIGDIFSQIDSLREVWCVNMFSSYMTSVNEEYVIMTNVNEEYVIERCFLEKNTGKENYRQGKVI